MTWPLSRGQVVLANIGLSEPKRLVVVSNNRRNRALQSVLAARLTTSPKPTLPSIVALGHDDPMTGHVCCDDIIEVFDDEVVACWARSLRAPWRAWAPGLPPRSTFATSEQGHDPIRRCSLVQGERSRAREYSSRPTAFR